MKSALLKKMNWQGEQTCTKLTTNGDPEEKTYKPEVLKWHREHNSGFKFVITSADDIQEIWRKYVKMKMMLIYRLIECGLCLAVVHVKNILKEHQQ